MQETLDNLAIGNRVRMRREALRWTREQLAEKADISVSFASGIELGTKGMSANTLYKLSRALGISADYLLFGELDGPQGELLAALAALSPSEQIYAEQLLKLFAQALRQEK